jgi:hypothetical protein
MKPDNVTHVTDKELAVKAWEMFTLLVRLKNIAPGHQLRQAEIYQEIVTLVDSLGYR